MTEPAASEPLPEPVQNEPLPPPARPPRDLGGWERAAAAVIGLGGTGVGGFGIFLSENQAGTAVILVLGVIFLLMAVQGTAVRRITRDGGDFADRLAYEQRAVNQVQQTLDERGSKAAQIALDAATAARPELERSPALGVINAQIYEREVLEAVYKAYGAALRGDKIRSRSSMRRPDAGFDAVLTGRTEDRQSILLNRIGVDVAYWGDGSRLNSHSIRSRVLRLNSLKTPYLIVTSARITRSALEAWDDLPRPVPREIVQWTTDSSLEDLQYAIEKILSQTPDDIAIDRD